jgi:hypothetical protein
MSWVTTERRRQEEPNHLQGLLAGMHPGADADHVRVVVLSTELCRVQVVCERSPGADYFVRSNLFAVARPADHDAQRAGVGHGGLGGRDAEDGIVVLGVVRLWPVVNQLVPVLGESLDQIVLQLKSGVVAADVYAHGSTMADPAGTDEHRLCSFASLQRSTLPRGVQRLRLMCSLSKLLDAGRETADDVAAGEGGQHGRGR